MLLAAAARRRVNGEVVLLAVGAALALAGIDVVFVSRGVIPPIYLTDAAAEALISVAWAAAWFARRPAAG